MKQVRVYNGDKIHVHAYLFGAMNKSTLLCECQCLKFNQNFNVDQQESSILIFIVTRRSDFLFLVLIELNNYILQLRAILEGV